MDPIGTTPIAAAILEGYRRAMSESTPLLPARRDERTLTDIVERATEHAQGLAAFRVAGTGERLDRDV